MHTINRRTLQDLLEKEATICLILAGEKGGNGWLIRRLLMTRKHKVWFPLLAGGNARNKRLEN